MKKWIALSIAVISMFIGIRAWAASQPQSLGTVALQFPNLTAAQILVSTASYKGQPIYCSDCASNGGAGTVCISTANTSFNQFVLSTGTVCK